MSVSSNQKAIKPKIAFIGAGAMGSAIAKGVLRNEGSLSLYKAEEIILFDLNRDKLESLKQDYGFQISSSFDEMIDICSNSGLSEGLEQLIIAVKPKDIEGLLADLVQINIKSENLLISLNTVLVSIAAGVQIKTFEKFFPNNPIIRVMPNTPCQIGKGVSVLAPNSLVTKQGLGQSLKLFETLGISLVLDESKLDSVTALSGSGPAYIFLMIEALIEAGIKEGLDEESARQLAVGTVYGAGSLVYETGESASTLREKVTSPGGTTQAALESFAESNFKDIVAKAVNAASSRARELG